MGILTFFVSTDTDSYFQKATINSASNTLENKNTL